MKRTSFLYTKWALWTRLSATDKVVLAILAESMDGASGETRRRQEWLREATGLSTQTLVNSLRTLGEKALIKTTQAHATATTVYTFPAFEALLKEPAGEAKAVLVQVSSGRGDGHKAYKERKQTREAVEEAQLGVGEKVVQLFPSSNG